MAACCELHGPPSPSYVSPSGKATFTIGGTNITDKRYITTGQPQFAGGVVFGTYNAPASGMRHSG
jgi:iron complex outermembrane recepter protein